MSCNTTYSISDWSECNAYCGPGKRYRSVKCTDFFGRYVGLVRHSTLAWCDFCAVHAVSGSDTPVPFELFLQEECGGMSGLPTLEEACNNGPCEVMYYTLPPYGACPEDCSVTLGRLDRCVRLTARVLWFLITS